MFRFDCCMSENRISCVWTSMQVAHVDYAEQSNFHHRVVITKSTWTTLWNSSTCLRGVVYTNIIAGWVTKTKPSYHCLPYAIYSICKCLLNIKKKEVTNYLIAKATTNDFLYAANGFSLITLSEFKVFTLCNYTVCKHNHFCISWNDFPYLVFNNKTKNISYGDVLLHVCRYLSERKTICNIYRTRGKALTNTCICIRQRPIGWERKYPRHSRQCTVNIPPCSKVMNAE